MDASHPFAPGLEHVWLPYTQMKTARPPLPVVGAEGVRLRLADGRTLIDGIASWWTAAHGYGHPHIIEAIRRQAEVLPHVMFAGLVTEPAVTLSERLVALLPGDLSHVFLVESGSVAVEVAMKMAVQYWINRGIAGKTKFLTFRGAYHGDTMATMSLCDPDKGMHAHFKGYLPEQHVADLPVNEAATRALDDLMAEKGDEIAAVICEPLVQGAAGMKMYDAEALRRLREMTERHGLLLIVDEIFTGFARTGTMFAIDQAGVIPDIVTVSKALTGGVLPLSAAIARDHVYEAFLGDSLDQALMHGPTFMGNAMACAAANASLDLFETEPRCEQARAIEAQMQDELEPCRDFGVVIDVRVRGAIGAVQLDPMPPLDELRTRFVEKGVWVRPFADVIYLAPPLVIGADDLSVLTGAIREAVSEIV